MKHLFIINFIAIVFYSCDNTKLNVQTVDNITLIDSISHSNILEDSKDIFLESGRFFPIFYIGPNVNKIILNRNSIFNQARIPVGCYGDPEIDTPYIKNLPFTDLVVQIRPEFKLGQELKFIHYNELKVQIVDSARIFKSLPIFIYNNSNQPFNLCNITKTVLQTKVNRKWWDIYVHHNWCFQNDSLIMIPENGLIVAKYLCHYGDTLVPCRLKVVGSQDSCYSNEFIYGARLWIIDFLKTK